MPKEIKNKIVKTELISWEELKGYEFNQLKDNSNRDISKLKNSIINQGFSFALCNWYEHKFIIDGTGRHLALLELEKEGYEIPDLVVNQIQAENIKEAKKLALMVSSQHGQITQTSLADFTSIDFEIEELKELADSELNLGELDFMIENLEPEVVAQEDDFESPEPNQIKTDIVKGDIFEFRKGGKALHRLMCGDSTSVDDVGKLMNGEKADMVFTDPPYLMNYQGLKSSKGKHEVLKNDDIDSTEGGIFLSKIALIIKQFCNGSFYVCFYRLGIEKIINALMLNGLKYRSVIIWQKNHFNLSGSDYQNIYEPIIYGFNEQHNYYGGRTQSDIFTLSRNNLNQTQIVTQANSVYFGSEDKFYKLEKLRRKPKNYIDIKNKASFTIFDGESDIWEVEKTKENTVHPTMKPVQLCERGIKNSSIQGQSVLDLFLGSGSTMVASHQLNRRCFGMELDEKYCQVICDRMKKLDPELEIVKI